VQGQVGECDGVEGPKRSSQVGPGISKMVLEEREKNSGSCSCSCCGVWVCMVVINLYTGKLAVGPNSVTVIW